MIATAGVQVGSLSSSLSFDAGIISGAHSVSTNKLQRAMLLSAVTVLGETFGATDTTLRLSAGHSGAEETRWLSETTLMCRSARGSGQSKMLSVTAGSSGLMASTSALLSYDTYSVSLVAYANVAAERGTQLSVFGSMHRSAQYSEALRLQQTSAEATVWGSDTSMRTQPSFSDRKSVV